MRLSVNSFRRRTTQSLALLLVALSSHAPHAAEPGGRFTILQLNDVYRIEGLENGTRGGLARVRTIRRDLERQGKPVLILHAGDLLFPSIMGKYLNAAPMIRALNLLDGDPASDDSHLIATFGNHEFEKSREILADRVVQSRFCWVSSNILYKAGADFVPISKAFLNVHDTRVLNIGGVTVGIFGLTLDVQKADYIRYRYQPVEERKKLIADRIASLKQEGAQVLIALTHQEMPEDAWLAREFPEVNLVVGGHEHFAQERKVGSTWITKADSDARTVVLIDVEVGKDGRISTSPIRKTLDETIAKDKAMEREVQASMTELKVAYRTKEKGLELDTVYGATEFLLEGEEVAIRGRETALGSVLADIIRETMDADIGAINGGAIRINDNIPAGSDITGYHLAGVFYYDDPLVKFSIGRDTLLKALRNSVSKVHLGDGRFLQVSGLRFKYHKAGSAEDPTYDVRPEEVFVESPRGSGQYKKLSENPGPFSIAVGKFLFERGSEDGFDFTPAGRRPGTLPDRLDDPSVRVSIRKATETKLQTLKAQGRRVTVRVDPAPEKRRIVEVRD